MSDGPDERYAAVHVAFARDPERDHPLDGDDPLTVAVNAIFSDLRDRRLLKWLFGPPGSGDHVMPGLDRIDDETQAAIAAQWRETIRQALVPVASKAGTTGLSPSPGGAKTNPHD